MQPQRPSLTDASPRSELGAALHACRNALIGVGLMSFMINLLYLTGSFFMLEVYDRVLPSRSVPTLVGLSILAGGLYIAQGVLDLIRGRILSRIGANSKVVLTHDIAQRDNLRVGRHDGVVAVVEKLKGHPLFAHVTLTRSERSPIAALVTEMLEDVTL